MTPLSSTAGISSVSTAGADHQRICDSLPLTLASPANGQRKPYQGRSAANLIQHINR